MQMDASYKIDIQNTVSIYFHFTGIHSSFKKNIAMIKPKLL